MDGSGSEHDEGEGGIGGVEAVGPSGDEADFGVEAFDSAVADAVFDGVQDEVSAVTHRLGGLDERGETGSLCAGTPPVKQFGGFVAGEVAGEDRPELFFHLICPPDPAAGPSDLGELGSLGVSEVVGVLQ